MAAFRTGSVGRRWKRVVVASVLSFCLATPFVHAAEPGAGTQSVSEAQPLDQTTAKSFLDEFFASEAVQPYFVGASVAIVKDGEVVAEEGYGYADLAQEKQVEPSETVFRVASVSKTFTAVAMMQLVEAGKVDLNDDIRTYLGDIPYDNPFGKPVTVGQLLTHTTGFAVQDPRPEDIHTDFEKVVEIEEFVRERMPSVVREPGSSYMYDNFGSLLAGLIVERASGERFEAYMDRHVFGPAGMTRSGFKLQGELLNQLAVGYDAANQPLETYTLTPTVMPHGGMLSTAADMSRFMLAFLNGGSGSSGRLLSESSVKEMSQYRSWAHELLPDTTYGFEAAPQLPGAGSSPEVIGKAGDLGGYSSYLFLIPEQKTGVFLTYNKQGALRDAFYAQFMATFFPQYVAPADLKSFEPDDSEQLAKFEGHYADLRLSAFVSSIEAGQGEPGVLLISDALIGPRKLRQVGETLFVDELSNRFTAFRLDDNGQVAYMKEPYINPLGYARKGVKAVGFADVAENHPYAEPILALQSLGYYPNDAKQNFGPQVTVTRGDYVKRVLEASLIQGSTSTDYAFDDIANHSAAAFIQQAYALGMVEGDGTSSFHPDRAITRQEVAVMLWRMYKLQFPPELYQHIQLSGDTAEWAVEAVKMMVAFGYHGPEVAIGSDGTANYHSLQALTRQEEAALLFALLTRPLTALGDNAASELGETPVPAGPETEAESDTEVSPPAEATPAGEPAA